MLKRSLLLLTPVMLLTLSACSGGGAVSVFGNNGNNTFEADPMEQLASALAAHPDTPEIQTAELAQILEQIRAKAHDGDLDAALVVFTLAAKQQQAKAEAEQAAQEQQEL